MRVGRSAVDERGVGRGADRIQAAPYLSRLLENGAGVPPVTRIRPIGVVARRSTDSYAIDDPVVAAAALYIRNHAVKGIKVKDVLAAVPTSRRVWKRAFALTSDARRTKKSCGCN